MSSIWSVLIGNTEFSAKKLVKVLFPVQFEFIGSKWLELLCHPNFCSENQVKMGPISQYTHSIKLDTFADFPDFQKTSSSWRGAYQVTKRWCFTDSLSPAVRHIINKMHLRSNNQVHSLLCVKYRFHYLFRMWWKFHGKTLRRVHELMVGLWKMYCETPFSYLYIAIKLT